MTLKQSHSSLFVQIDGPGTKPEPLGDCTTLDGLPAPRGGVSPNWCHTRDRKSYRHTSVSREAPGTMDFTITDVLGTDLSKLEEAWESQCFIAVYDVYRCGAAGIFDAWQRVDAAWPCYFTDNPRDNPNARDSDEEITYSPALSAIPPRFEARRLTASRVDIDMVDAANDVAVCNPAECGDCGPPKRAGDDVLVVGDAPAGSPAGPGDVYYSEDAEAFSVTTESPFAAGENIISSVCFEVDDGTVRWLVVRDTDGAAALEVEYTDDMGATAWTAVTVGDTVGEAATGPNALFQDTMNNVYLCTDEGNVFKSEDGGETWEEQDSANVASGGTQLNAIHFLPGSTYGVAVGESDTVIYTEDGGNSWQAGTATGGGDGLTGVQVLSRWRVYISTDYTGSGSGFYQSFDFCTTWTEVSNSLADATDGINDFEFANDLQGAAVTGTATNAKVLLTVNGGYSWQTVPTDDNSGLNAIASVNGNYYWAVGEAEGASAVVLRVK